MEPIPLLIIGAGPGGYVAAIRASQLGIQVCLVEKYNTLGGTCLNVGCIPSKALLDSSELYHQVLHRSISHGIQIVDPQIDIRKMFERKNDVVLQNTKGIDFLMKKHKIQVKHGIASFLDSHSVKIVNNEGRVEILTFEKAIVATGSKPHIPEQFSYDKKRIISSTEALQLNEIPEKLCIIGAGVIGLELGSVFARLGSKVEVLEYMDGILAGMELDCALELQKSLKALGIQFHFSRSVERVVNAGNQVEIFHIAKDGGEEQQITADYCLVCIGRKANTNGLNPEAAGIGLDTKGRIIVDENLQTTVKNIYAIGDVIAGPMLAHKAEEEAVFVIESLAGQKPKIHYDLIPSVVYTWPELASVGKTEAQLKSQGIAYKTGKFPFKALGRSRASMDVDGLVKVLADQKTDRILGVHILGARAADLIMEATALMEFGASAEDMARICHPHPTYSEAMKEAALQATESRAIHM